MADHSRKRVLKYSYDKFFQSQTIYNEASHLHFFIPETEQSYKLKFKIYPTAQEHPEEKDYYVLANPSLSSVYKHTESIGNNGIEVNEGIYDETNAFVSKDLLETPINELKAQVMEEIQFRAQQNIENEINEILQ